MLGRKLGRFWKFCWGVIVPGTLSFLFVYFITTVKTLKYDGIEYPNLYIVFGAMLVVIALIQLPVGMIYSYCASQEPTFSSKMVDVTTPTKDWGPFDQKLKNKWLMYLEGNSNISSDDEKSLIDNAVNE